MVFLQKFLLWIFPKMLFVNTKYLKLLTILIEYLPAIFFTMFKFLEFNKTYMKYTQFLKLLLATIAKSSSVAKF